MFGGVVAVQDREAEKSMTASSLKVGARLRLAAGDFQRLLDALAGRGYRVMGPTLEDGQLIYGEIGKVTDLPVGWTAIQEGGTFRLEPRPDQAFFGFAVGQQSWKQFLVAAAPDPVPGPEGRGRIPGSSPGARRSPSSPSWESEPVNWRPWRCRTGFFCKGPHVDPTYKARREQAFIVALNCGHQEPGRLFLRFHGDRAPGRRGV